MYYGERMIYTVFHLWETSYYAVPIIHTRIHLRTLWMVLLKYRDVSNKETMLSLFSFGGILPRDDVSSITRLLIKETNNILKSSCSLNHTNFVDQDANWIQLSGFLQPDLFYLDKLHSVEKRNHILARFLHISVKKSLWISKQLLAK